MKKYSDIKYRCYVKERNFNESRDFRNIMHLSIGEVGCQLLLEECCQTGQLKSWVILFE